MACDTQSNDLASNLNPPSEVNESSSQIAESGKEYSWNITQSETSATSNLKLISTASSGHALDYSIETTESIIKVTYTFSRTSNMLVNELIKLQLTDENNILAELDVKVVDIPKMSELNWPQRSLFKNDIMVSAISNQNQINFYWLNLPSWSVPSNPTWKENPFQNISWQMFYVSLGWVTSLGESYKKTSSPSTLLKIENLIIDFNSTFPDIESNDFELIYREDAVSIRTNHLLYLYLNFKDVLSSAAVEALENQISNHFIKLNEYVNDPQYDDDNHGLIQARAALNLVASLPLEVNAGDLREAALSRISKASAAMFSPKNGLSIEQAFDYHYAGISMLLEAKQQIKKVGLTPPESLINTLEKAILTGTYFLYSDGTIPALGDTYYGGEWTYFVNRYIELLDVDSELLERFLNKGQSALKDSYLIEEEGLYIGKRAIQNKQDKYFFEFGKPRIVHGHFDNLNILAELGSKKLLIDSGGPYTYSYQGRTNFWSKYAQNNLVIDNTTLDDGATNLVYLTEDQNITAIQAKQYSASGAEHSRTVVYNNHLEHSLMVFDHVIGGGTVEEFWHFPPKALIEELADGTNRIELEDGSIFYHYRRALQTANCKVREGEFDSTGTPSIGWVSPAYNVAEPAPVNYCLSNGGGYVTVNLFTLSKIPQNSFKLTLSGDLNYEINLLDFQMEFDQNLNLSFLDEFPDDPTEWRDSDQDGIGNNAETDSDNDGLEDEREIELGLDPYSSDTDGDGIKDGVEVEIGSDPLNANEDTDGDGYSNIEEKQFGTNPQSADDYPQEFPAWINVLFEKK